MIKNYGETNTPHKVATGTKPSVSNVRIILFPYVVWKATEQVDGNALNMSHQPQNGFLGIFFGIPLHQKGYLVYISSTEK